MKWRVDVSEGQREDGRVTRLKTMASFRNDEVRLKQRTFANYLRSDKTNKESTKEEYKG